MKILIVISNDEETGGVATVIRNLAQSMIERGHELFFLHSGKAIFLKPKITKSGFPGFELRLQMPFGDRNRVVSLLVFLILFPIGIYEILRLIRKYQIDIVNVHYPTSCFWYFAICKRILATPLVTSVHGADLFPQGKLEGNHGWPFKFLLSSSDRIVAPSQGFRKMLISAFPQLEEKTSYIHNGIDLRELERVSLKAVVDVNVPYILCISAYKEQKAIEVLISAFKNVHDNDSSLRLVIVGEGPLRQNLQELVAVLGLSNVVELRGRATRAEVASLLRGCRIFVLPSRFETFGIVLLEAMAYEKPVVATSVLGIPEIIDNGKNGILVEPDDPNALAEALLMVLKDKNLERALAQNGHTTLRERFLAEDMGCAYEAVFRHLIFTSSPLAAAV